ncbi:MAG: sulfatase, partial [Candidatus Hydrogenedentes bacterium]|nr:sulfatase [Candidatus Hydrogenedentota bacterium]
GGGGWGGASVALGLTFGLVELIKWVRSSFWTPLELGYAGVFALGVILYVLAVFAVAGGLRSIVRRVFARKRVPAPVYAAVAGAILWAVLAVFRDDVPSVMDGLVAVALVAWVAWTAFAPRVLRVPVRALYAVWAVAVCAGGVAAVCASHGAFLVPARRHDVATVAGLLWAGVAGVLLVAAWLATRKWKRGRALRIALAAALLVAPAVQGPLRARVDGAAREPAGPNILFVTCDALRAQSCSPYGGPASMPALESVAAGGVLFARGYSLCPWTTPSMFSLFASTYPPSLTPGNSREQWRDEMASYTFAPGVTTLAEVLAGKGYATAAFVGNPLLSDPNGILRGFQYSASFDPHIPLHAGPLDVIPYLKNALLAVAPGLVPWRPVDSSRILTRYALDFLDKHRGQSVFLWIHYMDPHEPYDPPAAYRDMEGAWPLFCPAAPYWNTPQQDDAGDIAVDEADRPFVQHLYEGEVRYVDACFGEVLARLDALEVAGRTYVCFTADHGEELWEHGRFGHGQSLYDELVHVPLVFGGPGLAARRIDAPVSGVDVMPTLAELAGVEAPEEWRGVSLAPVLRDAAAAPAGRPCFAQATNRYSWPEVYRVAVEPDRKLIHGMLADSAELYDIARDPEERRNLAGGEGAEAERLRGMLEAWAESFDAFLDVADVDEDRRQELLEQLESMGYVR